MYELYQGASIGPYPYYIVRKLGGGPNSMSEIYLATVAKPFQQKCGMAMVVLKIAALEKIETNNRSIRNEEEFLPRLNHPGIVRIQPIWTADKSPRVLGYRARATLLGEPWFCVFEYIPGNSLAHLLRRKWRISTHYAVDILIRIAEVLRYLHERGIVHLDIKPSNILLRKHGLLHWGSPTLIDFGICCKFGQKSSGGTIGYMAPERGTGTREVAAAPCMDVYGLGVVMWELLKPAGVASYKDLKRTRVLFTQSDQLKYGDYLYETLTGALHEDTKSRSDIGLLLTQLRELKLRLKPYHWLWLYHIIIGAMGLWLINPRFFV